MTLKKTIEQHKYIILFCLILVFGSILRLVQLGKVPGGYQMDEAYGAFNAYSLFHSGIDSTGHSYPVYFESWGGGQNARTRISCFLLWCSPEVRSLHW